MRSETLVVVLAAALIQSGHGLRHPRREHPLHRVYYERDRAGLSNVKLGFESLVAIAAVYNRELMIPPASLISHYWKNFSELELFNETSLGKVVKYHVVEDGENTCPETAYKLPRGLNTIDLNTLPFDQDWCFKDNEYRIQHFECLRFPTEKEKAVAAQAVFNGLQLQDHWVQGARAKLQKLGLTPGQFAAVHIRRRDMIKSWEHAPKFRLDEELTTRAQGLPLLVATDALPDDSIRKEINRAKASRMVFTEQAYSPEEKGSLLYRSILDMIMCVMGQNFMGTPGSTFSNSIIMLRKKIGLCEAKSQKAPLLLDVKAASQQEHRYSTKVEKFWHDNGDDPKSGICWQRVTSFAHLDSTSATSCQMSEYL